ncbi:MAG: LPXTG cell wall anchor domain-containing protein, partial [Erysipelothrix sp.]|nr:LPXTG cell wall anchor domain-containing protein [Erysipelothrix sp.]
YNSKMPVTGISNNLTLYLGILLISSLSLIRYFRKSKNNAKS